MKILDISPNLSQTHSYQSFLRVYPCSCCRIIAFRPANVTLLPTMKTTTICNLPSLQRIGASTQLLVNGRPFHMLGGELQNSALSSSEYMDTVWSKLAASNFNTVLGSVSWEQVEPKEGEFDFAELDRVILGARKHNLRLILLWFGSYKNGNNPDSWHG